jgi:uncharacterized alkaline shock family protein YloU
MSGQIQQVGTKNSADKAASRAEAQYQLKVATNAIMKIAEATAREVEGLHLTQARPRLFSRVGVNYSSSPDGGIRAGLDRNHEVSLALWMTADYGVHIPTLAQDLRRRLTEKIERMTDFHTRSVRIEITDVITPTAAMTQE